jgi:hypothetical protein
MIPSRTFVVARYQEPVELTNVLPDGWTRWLVQKGEHMPNVGREAGSYAWWVREHYARLDPVGTYAFVQADPFIHGYTHDQLRDVDWYQPLGRYRLECMPDGTPQHPELALDDAWDLWFGDQPRPVSYTFHAGALFLASGAALQSRPVEWWSALYRWVCDDPQGPWLAERLWPHWLRAPRS